MAGYVLLIIYFHSISNLRNRADKSKRLPPIYKVSKTVYASPSRVNFRLDQRKVKKKSGIIFSEKQPFNINNLS